MKWYKSPWFLIPFGIFASPIGTLIIDFFLNRPIFSTFKLIWEAFLFITTFKIPVYSIFLFILLLAVPLVINRNRKIKTLLINPYQKYTEDIFQDIRWTWRWEHNGNGWTIINLEPHCRDDDTILMVSTSFRTGEETYQCPRCNKLYGRGIGKRKEISVLIRDNILKGNYPK